MRSGPERPNQESGREPRKRLRLQTQPTRTAIPPALRQYSPHRRASLRRSSSPPLMSAVYLAGHYDEVAMIAKGSRPRLGTPIHVEPLGSTGTLERPPPHTRVNRVLVQGNAYLFRLGAHSPNSSSFETPTEVCPCTIFHSPTSIEKTAVERVGISVPSSRVHTGRLDTQSTLPSTNALTSPCRRPLRRLPASLVSRLRPLAPSNQSFGSEPMSRTPSWLEVCRSIREVSPLE